MKAAQQYHKRLMLCCRSLRLRSDDLCVLLALRDEERVALEAALLGVGGAYVRPSGGAEELMRGVRAQTDAALARMASAAVSIDDAGYDVGAADLARAVRGSDTVGTSPPTHVSIRFGHGEGPPRQPVGHAQVLSSPIDRSLARLSHSNTHYSTTPASSAPGVDIAGPDLAPIGPL